MGRNSINTLGVAELARLFLDDERKKFRPFIIISEFDFKKYYAEYANAMCNFFLTIPNCELHVLGVVQRVCGSCFGWGVTNHTAGSRLRTAPSRQRKVDSRCCQSTSSNFRLL